MKPRMLFMSQSSIHCSEIYYTGTTNHERIPEDGVLQTLIGTGFFVCKRIMLAVNGRVC
jgi:hypothetical protein